MTIHRHAPEETLQIAVVAFLRVALPVESGVLFYHVPNGGRRDVVTAARLKAMGTLPGVPDLAFYWRDTLRYVGWIELKSATGSLSTAQKEFRDRVLALGHFWQACRSIEEVEGTLRGWLPPGTLCASVLPLRGAA